MLVLCGVLAGAVAVRLPNLMSIPIFTDEVEEVARALAIVQHGSRPLTNVDPYIGAFWNYLLALAFWLFGPHPETPRIVVLGSGVLTVLATHLLGRALYGWRVGLLGSALLATSAVHTAVNSHVAWSNCVTPLFTTVGLAALAVALRDDRPRWLVAVGVLFGAAFHTHPTALPVLLGSALAVLVARPGWLRGRWPAVAAGAAILSNANLLAYNLLTGGRTFSYAQEIQTSYLRETGGSTTYPERLLNLLLGLGRGLGGLLEQQATRGAYLGEPLLWLAGGLALAGLILGVRRRAWLPVGVVAVTVLFLPLANGKYDPILNGRYLAPILPIGLLWIALAVEQFARLPQPAWPALLRAARGPHAWRAGTVLLAALVAGTVMLGSVRGLDRYYREVRENARTGKRIMEVVATARRLGPAAYPVVLDQRLDRLALGPGAGITLRVLETSLHLAGIPTTVAWLGEQRPPGVREGQLLVLAIRSKPQFTAEAVTALGLRTVDGRKARAHSQASLYGVYRFGSVSTAGTAGLRR